MELSSEQIDSILESALPDVTERLKEQLVQKIGWAVTEEASRQIRSHITEWMTREVIPEVEVKLVEARDGLVSAAISCGPIMAEQIAKALAEELGEKLGKSYSRRQIFEAILK